MIVLIITSGAGGLRYLVGHTGEEGGWRGMGGGGGGALPEMNPFLARGELSGWFGDSGCQV